MKLHSPAADRNTQPILTRLREHLPEEGLVVEVPCGSGQHAVAFSEALPGLQWLPLDVDPRAVASAAAWRREAGLQNLLEPRLQDVTQRPWAIERADVVFSANMVHIAPPDVAEALMAEAGRLLGAGGVLFLYGPFNVGGSFTSASNAAFDRSLRSRDSSWGIRDLEWITELAEAAGLVAVAKHAMPANNFSLVFEKGG